MQSAISTYAGRFWDQLKIRDAYKSTKGHRYTLRAISPIEVTSAALDPLSPLVIIFAKTAQCIISAAVILRSDTRFHEKFLHALQVLISAAQVTLAMIVLFSSMDCKTNSTDLCKALLVLQVLYRAAIVTGSFGEVAKAPRDTGSQQQSGQGQSTQQVSLQSSQQSQTTDPTPPVQQTLGV